MHDLQESILTGLIGFLRVDSTGGQAAIGTLNYCQNQTFPAWHSFWWRAVTALCQPPPDWHFGQQHDQPHRQQAPVLGVVLMVLVCAAVLPPPAVAHY